MTRGRDRAVSMIRVLIVEDSRVMREFLIAVLSGDPEIEVVGVSEDGEAALRDVERLSPDVVTMDVHMPRLDGISATRRIMERHPVPIVIVSASIDPEEVEWSFKAVEAGALMVLKKPAGNDAEKDRRDFVTTVKLMSEVKVVRRWAHGDPAASRRDTAAPIAPTAPAVTTVVIGASTGGPPVFRTILAGLDGDFGLPVLAVQHMAEGFIGGFVRWLADSSGFPVSVAEDGERPEPGKAYFAPDGAHMLVGVGGTIRLARDERHHGLRPAVARLFRSAAEVYGPAAVGVLLTGMGEDGAEELGLLKNAGAMTVAQDEASSVVWGMPGTAARIGAADRVMAPEEISAFLNSVGRAGKERLWQS